MAAGLGRQTFTSLALATLALAACTEASEPLAQAPAEEVDARAYCADVDAGPLVALASSVEGVVAGACGHLIYDADGQGYLYSPGSGPEAIDAGPRSGVFAPTGNLAAWRHADGGLALRELLTGEQHELAEAQTFGFVPAPDAAHGADLWTCVDETLELAGPEDAALVAEGVDCDSVGGSTGSPRVVFADLDGKVHIADLETLELAQLDGLDYANGPEVAGERDDELWIDHDGLVVVHRSSRWLGSPGSDNESKDLLGVEVVAITGEFASWAEDAPMFPAVQAAVRSAPVVLRAFDSVTAIADGARHDRAGASPELEFDRLGRGVSIDEDAGELWRVGDDGAFELLASNVTPIQHQVAPGGEWIAIEHYPCEDPHDDENGPVEPCETSSGTLMLWHEGEGLRAPELAGFWWQLLGVNDVGELVVWGVPTADPADDHQLLLLDAEFQTLGSYPVIDGYPTVAAVLDDGRFVLDMWGTEDNRVLIADAAQGITPVASSEGVVSRSVWVDATQDKLAFLAVETEGLALYAGSLPN